jgi:hypothetical protein
VVRDNPGEAVFPDNPFLKSNGQIISTTDDGYKVTGAYRTIVWYKSSVQNEKTDTFFRHGIFVIQRPIKASSTVTARASTKL